MNIEKRLLVLEKKQNVIIEAIAEMKEYECCNSGLNWKYMLEALEKELTK